jgi:hypothetical protein
MTLERNDIQTKRRIVTVSIKDAQHNDTRHKH